MPIKLKKPAPYKSGEIVDSSAIQLPTVIPFVDKIAINTDIVASLPSVAAKLAEMLHAGELGPEKMLDGYSYSYRIQIPSVIDAKKRPLIQARGAGDGKVRLRLEFSPAGLKLPGLKHAHKTLKMITPKGWLEFLQNGYVSRVEVSMDVPDVSMADFRVLPDKALSHETWKVDGSLETIMLGKKRVTKPAFMIAEESGVRKNRSNFHIHVFGLSG